MKAKYTRFTTEQILQCRQNNFMMEELIKNTDFNLIIDYDIEEE